MNRGSIISTCTLVLGVGAVALTLPSDTASAGVTPLANAFTYQGRLDVGGSPYSGTADFVFRLFDGPGGGAGQIGPAVPANNVTVTDGVFTVTLDFGAVFQGDERYLDIQVDTPAAGGGGPFTALTPRQLLAATPYAAFALAVNGSAITNLNANNLVSGTVPSGRISGGYGNAVNFNNGSNQFTGTFSGTGTALTGLNANNISTGILPIARGGTGASNSVGALTNLNAQQRVTGTAPLGQYIRAINADGTVVTGTDSDSGGDITGVTAGSGLSGGGSSGSVVVSVAANGITNTMLASDAASLSKVSAGELTSSGGFIGVNNTSPSAFLDIFGGSSVNGASFTAGVMEIRNSSILGAYALLFDGNEIQAENGGNANTLFLNYWGGNMNLVGSGTNATGRVGLGTAAPGATLHVSNEGTAHIEDVLYIGASSSSGARMELDGLVGGETRMSLYNSLGNNTVFMDTDSLDHGRLLLRESTGSTRVALTVESDNTGQIVLYNGTGSPTIEIDGGFGDSDGRIITDELQITGGSDLSEQFDISDQQGGTNVEPGMVVCIDPNNPGELIVSSRAYDRCVAGIVSGAGGIKPGMLMGQKDSMADGQHPVALTGRVFVRVTDANGTIEPGDLLTSSDVSGCAMKVTDFAKAQGAIIGKAMTRPDRETGMVLVLVGLQ